MLDKQVCNNIKMVLLDVDGVMTDGSIYVNQDGEFFKSFNVKDGLAIELLRSHNIFQPQPGWFLFFLKILRLFILLLKFNIIYFRYLLMYLSIRFPH